ncbi:MAG: protein-L-isoaspartate(D-aspartate) O-methyltransferase [Nitrospirota bacterium]
MPHRCSITIVWTACAIGAMIGCGEASQRESFTADPSRQRERNDMVEEQLVARGVRDRAVLAAMRRVPRHRFVPDMYAPFAYGDGALPIGHDQSISQPYLVARMTEALALRGKERVLEVGTGSGYQAAVLAEIAAQVYTIEILAPLADRAAKRLAELGYANVQVRAGDGYLGWPEAAPFDAILVTAAADHVPEPLLRQLAPGGRLILPLGRFFQRLVLYRRTQEGYERTELDYVRFVPLIRQEPRPGAEGGGAP